MHDDILMCVLVRSLIWKFIFAVSSIRWKFVSSVTNQFGNYSLRSGLKPRYKSKHSSIKQTQITSKDMTVLTNEHQSYSWLYQHSNILFRSIDHSWRERESLPFKFILSFIYLNSIIFDFLSSWLILSFFVKRKVQNEEILII